VRSLVNCYVSIYKITSSFKTKFLPYLKKYKSTQCLFAEFRIDT